MLSLVRALRDVCFLLTMPFGYGYRLRKLHRLLYAHRDIGELAAVGCAGVVGGHGIRTRDAHGHAEGAQADDTTAEGGAQTVRHSVGVWCSVFVVIAVSRARSAHEPAADDGSSHSSDAEVTDSSSQPSDAALTETAHEGHWVITAAGYCVFGALRAPFYPLPFLLQKHIRLQPHPLVPTELYQALPHRRRVCTEIAHAAAHAATLCRHAICAEVEAAPDAALGGVDARAAVGWRLPINHDRVLETKLFGRAGAE